MSARDELRDLIAAKLAEHSGLFNDYPIVPDLANAVMQVFYGVQDEWEQIDITEMQDDGRRYLDQRWLVARVPRESRHQDRVADRTVRS